MPLYTITNVPPVEVPDPSLMTEITGLVTAVTALIAVLVWPILIGFGLRIYREPITQVLGRVRGAKGLGVELEMQELIESTAEAQTAASPAAEPIAPEVPQQDGLAADEIEDGLEGMATTNPTRIDLADIPSDYRFVRHEALRSLLSSWLAGNQSADNTFESLARIHRPSAVLFAWGEVEKRIKQLAEINGLRNGPTFALIEALRREGQIKSSLHPLLKDLNRIRNRVAHGDEDLSDKFIVQFRDSAQTAERELGEMIAEALKRKSDPSEIAHD